MRQGDLHVAKSLEHAEVVRKNVPLVEVQQQGFERDGVRREHVEDPALVGVGRLAPPVSGRRSAVEEHTRRPQKVLIAVCAHGELAVFKHLFPVHPRRWGVRVVGLHADVEVLSAFDLDAVPREHPVLVAVGPVREFAQNGRHHGVVDQHGVSIVVAGRV